MCVKMLLESPNAAEMINLKDNQGRTPLHSAACFGHWECTNLLLDHNADPDLSDDEVCMCGCVDVWYECGCGVRWCVCDCVC